MGFDYLSTGLSNREEALFSINVNRDLGYDLTRKAFNDVLNEKDEKVREHFMVQILNGLMAKKPTVEEVTGLLDAIFEFDEFDPISRGKLPGVDKTITYAGSGKKGMKTVNISSLAAFVGACCGLKILKLCSPSTSSATGSQDFLSILIGKQTWDTTIMDKLVGELGIGFFPVESVLPRFAAIYSGRFFAPHALSFALAGMATRYKTDYMLYGLSHPNTGLSVKVYKHYEIPQVMVISSTPDGIHYMDEACSIGGTFIEGYASLDTQRKKQGVVYFGEVLDREVNEKVFMAISQKKNQLNNVVKGLSGLTGSNKVLGKQVAINAAILMFLENGGDVKQYYDKCLEVIDSGEPLKKMRDFIKAVGGDVQNLGWMIDKSRTQSYT